MFAVENPEECWLGKWGGSQSAEATACCGPQLCGLSSCWLPPLYTYDFCCNVDACRPSLLAEVKGALDLAVESLPDINASMLAIQVASEAFRSLLKLQVSLARADQLCDSAIAYAAAALVQMPEKSQELKLAIQPRWFVYGIDWNRLQKDGWGGIFGWIDRRPTQDQREETVIPETSGFFSMDLEQRRNHLTSVIEVEQAKAQWLMSSLNDTEDLTSIFHIFFSTCFPSILIYFDLLLHPVAKDV